TRSGRKRGAAVEAEAAAPAEGEPIADRKARAAWRKAFGPTSTPPTANRDGRAPVSVMQRSAARAAASSAVAGTSPGGGAGGGAAAGPRGRRTATASGSVPLSAYRTSAAATTATISAGDNHSRMAGTGSGRSPVCAATHSNSARGSHVPEGC